MKLLRNFVIVFLSVYIALAPAFVEARAGSSRSSGGSMSNHSMGSRGSKTYESNSTKPMERSMTQKPAPAPTPPRQATPAPQPTPMAPPMAQPSFFQQHPFMAGIAGGLVGSWIGSMLFNHSRSEAGMGNNDWDSGSASPMGRTLGALLPILFIAGLIMLGMWFYRRNAAQSLASGTTGYSPEPMRSNNEAWGSSSTAAAPVTYSLQIGQGDISAFKDLLVAVQDAWGKADLVKLKRVVTPEMLSYFSEELSNNASQGVENRVEQVNVLRLDIKDAWEEENMQYASAQITWNSLDYTINTERKPGDADYVVDGDMRQLAEATEVWTFVRSQSGGHWLLSAIQQI